MPKVLLRKLKITDKKYFAKWWRDKSLSHLMSGSTKYVTDKEVDEYFSAFCKSRTDFHHMIIVEKKVIGHVFLSKNKKDSYSIQIVIGEKEYWNKGVGTKAIKIAIQKSKKKGVKKIALEVRPNNFRAIRAYEKCGFVKKGTKKYPKNKLLPEVLKMSLKQ